MLNQTSLEVGYVPMVCNYKQWLRNEHFVKRFSPIKQTCNIKKKRAAYQLNRTYHRYSCSHGSWTGGKKRQNGKINKYTKAVFPFIFSFLQLQ
jgi:hypothetical protein